MLDKALNSKMVKILSHCRKFGYFLEYTLGKTGFTKIKEKTTNQDS